VAIAPPPAAPSRAALINVTIIHNIGYVAGLMDAEALAALGLNLALGLAILLFILRIVLTWYPQIDLQRFPVNLVAIPTEPFLAPTRQLIPPLGGVDISPIVWVGLVSLLREVLAGQQGLVHILW